MFDEYLKQRDGDGFVPFDAHHDYDEYVDGLPRPDGVRSFLKSRGIDADEATVKALGDRKNELVLKIIERDGVEAYEGSIRYVHAAKDAGRKLAVVSSSANAKEVLKAVGILDLFDHIVDGHAVAEGGLKGKPAPDTFLAAAEALGARARARRGLRGRAGRRRGGPGRQLRGGCRRRPGRPGRRAGRPRRHHRRAGSGRAAAVTDHPNYSEDPWALREEGLDLERLAQSESVFALSNGHIGMRGNLDEGEPVRASRHLPQRPARGAPAALCRDRLRQPRGGRDGRQRHRRQAAAPARRRRALRRPLRRAAAPRARAGLPRRRAAAPRPLALADRRRGADHLDAAGVADPARRRGDPLRGRGARRRRAAGGPERVGGQRGRPGQAQGRRPAGGGRASRRR